MSHTTKHSGDCKRVFGRYDLDCERCRQLAAGDKARPGWGDLRRKAEAQRLQAIAEHAFAACARVHIMHKPDMWTAAYSVQVFDEQGRVSAIQH